MGTKFVPFEVSGFSRSISGPTNSVLQERMLLSVALEIPRESCASGDAEIAQGLGVYGFMSLGYRALGVWCLGL